MTELQKKYLSILKVEDLEYIEPLVAVAMEASDTLEFLKQFEPEPEL